MKVDFGNLWKARALGNDQAKHRLAAWVALAIITPVLAVTDAAVLATKVDGTILVLSAGRARRDAAKKAKRTLEELSARFIGVVVNNVKADRETQSGYYARS